MKNENLQTKKNKALRKASLACMALVAAVFVATPSAVADIIVHYNFEEAGSPLTDQVGGQAATEVNGGHLYQQASAAAGTYGSIALDNSLGNAVGITAGQTGAWTLDAAGAAELGGLTNDFTVMAWVYVPAAGIGDDWPRVIGDRNDPAGSGWSFGIRNKVDIFGSVSLSGNGIQGTHSVNVVQNGVWQHIAATKSSTDGVKLYYNGFLVDGVADYSGLTGNFNAGSGTWYLGGANDLSTDNNIQGLLMDEVRVYNTVLDADGIKAAAGHSGVSLAATVFISSQAADVSPGPDFDLTATYGNRDWAVWKIPDNPATGAPSDRKAGASLIGNITAVGGSGVRGTTSTDPAASFSWTDGTPTGSASATTDVVGLLNITLGSTGVGVQADVISPVSSPYTIYVWACAFNATGTLTVTVPGAAAPATDAKLVQGTSRVPGRFYVVEVDPQNKGDVVNVKLQVTSTTGTGTANASIAAIAVSAPHPPAGTVIIVK